MIEIDPSAHISSLADIEDSTFGSRIIFGPGVVIDSFVKIKPAGGMGNVVIGRNSIINSGCVIYIGNGIQIGEDVAIAANCVLAPVNHEFKEKNRTIRQQRFQQSRGGILIEDDVWIGAGTVLLDGAILRKGCVIGALSLVREEVPAYSIQGGNPLSLLGWRT
ncbi:MAG: acyltransferase [bacterium]